MRTLITGITGMIGTHFAKATRARGWETFGLARDSAACRMAREADRRLFRCDVLDRDALAGVFQKVRPELVVHLAAQAFNGSSWNSEETTHFANYVGTLNVLRCCRRTCPAAKVVLACSSAEYGAATLEAPVMTEDLVPRPLSPYGVSKVGSECLGYQYHANYGIPVYLPRLFIQVGPGHPPATAIQNFARQLAEISKGLAPPVVKVGRLEASRDFVDVRDGVAGMLLLVERGEPGKPINICTGAAHRISDVLQLLIEISGLTVEVRRDPGLTRPADEECLVGDNSRLKALGWQQRYSLRETLEEVYRDWLNRV